MKPQLIASSPIRPQLLGVTEFSESLFKEIRIGTHIASTGELKVNSVHLLKSVLEHRAIDLSEQITIDVHGAVRVNTEKIAVVGRMVNLAHAQSIGNHGLSPGMRIRKDVRGVEKSSMPQSTDRALVLIGK